MSQGNSKWQMKLDQLESIGFSKVLAQAALVQAQGDVDHAAELLATGSIKQVPA